MTRISTLAAIDAAPPKPQTLNEHINELLRISPMPDRRRRERCSSVRRRSRNFRCAGEGRLPTARRERMALAIVGWDHCLSVHTSGDPKS